MQHGSAAADAPASSQELPAGWSEHWSEGDNDYYFYHESTGESTWKRPRAAPRQPEPAAKRHAPEKSSQGDEPARGPHAAIAKATIRCHLVGGEKMTSSEFVGTLGSVAPAKYDRGDLPPTAIRLPQDDSGSLWTLRSLQAFVADKLRFSVGSSALLRTADGGSYAAMIDDDHAEIYMEDFPTLKELEVYEVTTSLATKLHNRGTASVAVSASTAEVAQKMATEAGAPKNPFKSPSQQPSTVQPSDGSKRLPSHEQYQQMQLLRQKQVQLQAIQAKLSLLVSQQAAEPVQRTPSPKPAPNAAPRGSSMDLSSSDEDEAGEAAAIREAQEQAKEKADKRAQYKAEAARLLGDVIGAEEDLAPESDGDASMADAALGAGAPSLAGAEAEAEVDVEVTEAEADEVEVEVEEAEEVEVEAEEPNAEPEREPELEVEPEPEAEADATAEKSAPTAHEVQLQQGQNELLLQIGKLQAQLGPFKLPKLNDEVLQDASSIEHYDEIAGVLKHVDAAKGGYIGSLVTTFADDLPKGAELLEKRLMKPVMTLLSRHENEQVQQVPEALVMLVLWHEFVGARDFLASMTTQLRADARWGQAKTELHRQYAGQLVLQREFNSVVETCTFSADGLRIKCSRGTDCVRAKRLRHVEPYSLGMPSNKPTDADSSWSVRNWRQKSKGKGGGCTLECFPFLSAEHDEAAATAAAAAAEAPTTGAMDMFASIVPTATAALAISATQEAFAKEMAELQEFSTASGLATHFVVMYGEDGPDYGDVSKPKLNAGISRIDDVARELGCATEVMPSGSCSAHDTCPTDCPVATLKGWRVKLMRATKAR